MDVWCLYKNYHRLKRIYNRFLEELIGETSSKMGIPGEFA